MLQCLEVGLITLHIQGQGFGQGQGHGQGQKHWYVQDHGQG